MAVKHAPAGLIRDFITQLGFDPDYVLELKVDPDQVVVFYGDAETQTAHLAKLPIIELIEGGLSEQS